MVTCTLLCIRRLNFAQQLSYQLPLVCQFIVRSPSANYVCQSCYLLVFLSTKSLSLRIRTQIGSRVLQIQVTFENARYYSSFSYHRDNKTIAIRVRMSFPLVKVKVLSVVYCLAICHLSQFPNTHPLYQVRTVAVVCLILFLSQLYVLDKPLMKETPLRVTPLTFAQTVNIRFQF